MKVAITGGRGFLGNHVIAQLQKTGCEIDVLGRGNVDYANPGQLRERLAGADVVMHLASIAHTRITENADALYRSAIVDVTRAVWSAAQDAGVRRFLFASTTKVYGERSFEAPFTEESPCAPMSPYGCSKLEAEAFLLDAAGKGPELYILRFPPMYGAGMRGAVRHFFRAARYRLPLPVHGLNSHRHFLFVGNAARLLEAAAEGRLAPRLYLAHDPESWTVGQFYVAIYRATNGRDLPRVMRWSMPRMAEKAVSRMNALAPLVAPLELSSKYLDMYKGFRISTVEALELAAKHLE